MPEWIVDQAEFGSLAEEILKTGRVVRFRAHGDSMRPFLWDGDLIELASLAPDAVRKGEIVLCRRSDGRLLLHRVMKAGGEAGCGRLLVQGDGLAYPDGVISAHQVIGKVLRVEFKQKNSILRPPLHGVLACCWLELAPLRPLLFRMMVSARDFWNRCKL